MELVIIQYNAGNIQSVLYALERIGVTATVTDDIEKIKQADKIIFPGVGEASSAMRYLQVRSLDTVIKSLQQPVLGICLGMQLMCSYSEENDTTCLGIFDETVKKFANKTPAGDTLKVPQIGWNQIADTRTALFTNIEPNSYCYFVHGYYAAKGDHTIATTEYGINYSAALHKNNFYGTQFHPEKSATVGEKILANFLSL